MTENTENINYHNKTLIEWQAPEFLVYKKDKKWFISAGIITILLLLYALYTDSATMAIVFLVLAGVYYLTHNQSPKIIDIKITELGIYVGEEFHPFNTINSFWIVYQPPYVQSLYIILSGKSLKKIVIQLNTQDPVEVRRALAKEIPEVEGGKESMLEILIRILKL